MCSTPSRFSKPIGGQSAVVKFRWGALPSDLLYEEATPFIKFALGENVKQSNWGDEQTIVSHKLEWV